MADNQDFNTPIVSICIPTYNRAGYLYFALKSIVDQDVFKNTFDVEIVILDNCSNDYTENITKFFTEKYPDKIRYYKNQEYVSNQGFEKIFSYAKGQLLKMYEDNFVMFDGALKILVKKIKDLSAEKSVVLFTNKGLNSKEKVTCRDLNQLVEKVSFLTTWLDSFSIWKEDYQKYQYVLANSDSKFKQTEVLFDLSNEGKRVVVIDEEFIEEREIFEKSGHNIAKIFGQNYLSLLKKQLKNKKLKWKIYEKQKKHLLLNYIIPMEFSAGIEHRKGIKQFREEGYWRYLLPYYWYNLYLYSSIVQILNIIIKTKLKIVTNTIAPSYGQDDWRRRNKHNETTVSKDVDTSKICVGKGVRGNINAKFFEGRNELLIIEDNVIIEPDVKFILGIKELIIIKENTVVKKGSVITR